MARSNVNQEVHRLDALSRTRALTAAESRVLEVMIKKQATYERLCRNGLVARRAMAPERSLDVVAHD